MADDRPAKTSDSSKVERATRAGKTPKDLKGKVQQMMQRYPKTMARLAE